MHGADETNKQPVRTGKFFTCQGVGLPTCCKSSVCESESNFFRRDFPRFFAIFRPLDDIVQSPETCISLPCTCFLQPSSELRESKLFPPKLFLTFLGQQHFRHLLYNYGRVTWSDVINMLPAPALFLVNLLLLPKSADGSKIGDWEYVYVCLFNDE